MRTVSLIGAPTDVGASVRGAGMGPDALRVAGLFEALRSHGLNVIDFQNDVMPSSLRHDEGHLNNDGSVLVARRIQEFINAKGW